MAIAEWVREALDQRRPRARPSRRASRELRMPNIGEFGTRPYQDAELIDRDPDYGRIVCFCERVTRGEIDAALRSPIPPADADGLRRRTRALMGRCQGFFCGAEVAAALGGQGWRLRTGRSSSAAGRQGWRRRSSCGGLGHPARDGDRARAGGRRDPPPLRPHRLRAARPAQVLSGPRYAERYRELADDAGRRGAGGDDGHRLGGRAGAEADRTSRPPGGRAARGGPRDRLPRASSLRAARPGIAAGRGDDHLDPPAARPPARSACRPPGGDRRR